jgi:KaiC/GvpD/RAD55 family RecA-like ATPase
LNDPDARKRVLAKIRVETLLDTDHAKILGAVAKAQAQGLESTPETIAHLSGGAVSQTYVAELRAMQVPSKNLDHHIDAVLWDSTRLRAAEGPLNELNKAVKDPTTPRERLRALSRQVGLSFDGAGSRQHLVDSSRLVTNTMDRLKKRRETVACYSFGVPGLDVFPKGYRNRKGKDVSGQPVLVPGTAPAKCSLVTAISGGGKSSIVARGVLGMARLGRKIGYAPWEMGPEDTLEMMAIISVAEKHDPTVTRTAAHAGLLTPEQEKLVQRAAEAISQRVSFVKLPFGKQRGVRHTHEEVLDAIHGYIADIGCDVMVFDLWRRAFRRMKDPADEEEALYRMQAIAEETMCHLLLVHQQRLKDIELRTNPVPTREGIKGTSAWVDVMDTIMGIYLPGLQKKLAQSTAEIHILKQRYGEWPIAVEYDWDPEVVGLANPRFVEYRPGDASADRPKGPVDSFLDGPPQ